MFIEILYVPGLIPSVLHVLIHLILTTARAGTIILPISQLRGLRPRGVQIRTRGHTALRCGSSEGSRRGCFRSPQRAHVILRLVPGASWEISESLSHGHMERGAVWRGEERSQLGVRAPSQHPLLLGLPRRHLTWGLLWERPTESRLKLSRAWTGSQNWNVQEKGWLRAGWDQVLQCSSQAAHTHRLSTLSGAAFIFRQASPPPWGRGRQQLHFTLQ
uniref:Uncharacterized protein n=1 Tax=Pipistrellus kuhlii TaxID=59472 RepID=A0A7J7UGA1_PIPKU|nr:hypothetical protein mPipKuh1_009104 [Pipistrellus kuhlii]